MTILDTNVVSELMRPVPAASVVRWVADQPRRSLFSCAVSLAEIMGGIAIVPDGKRKAAMRSVAERIFQIRLAGQVLPFDQAAAMAYAEILSARQLAGRPIGGFDGLIAAIARARGMAVATRDEGGFAACGLVVINPWAT